MRSLKQRTHIQKAHYLSIVCFFVLCAPVFTFAQGSLPVASTVTLEEGTQTFPGTVIVYDEASDSYAHTDVRNDARVYGVVSERPALLFATASGSVPVVTEGATYVRVVPTGIPIVRGDLLTTSSSTGVATRAELHEGNVFAFALEDYNGEGEGRILADISVSKAREAHNARTEAAEKALEEAKKPLVPTTFIRGTIAAMIAVGALIFMLFSFRSIVNNGVVSVGRNPRAQTSIITFAFGTVLGVVLLGGLALFVAIAVLILPV